MIRPGSRRRPFTPTDGLILAAGLGLAGWAVSRIDPFFLQMTRAYRSVSPPWPGMPAWALALELPLRRVQADLTAVLIPISLAVGLATFRRRVGGPRRVASSPGLAASAAAAGAVVVDLGVHVLLPWWQAGTLPHPLFWTNLMESFRLDVTAPLGAVWAYQVVGRLWHPRDDWRDWLGRWLGASWLLAVAIDLACLATWG